VGVNRYTDVDGQIVGVWISMEAYLDIETTGLSHQLHKITIVGLAIGNNQHITQLVGNNITTENLLNALKQATTIYTYNGTRFDLPFLHAHLGIDLLNYVIHRDLMIYCWKRNLFGGLKVVEKRLGIYRRLSSVDGLEAIRLWNRYEKLRDFDALRFLLEYNKEDVLNLRVLRKMIIETYT